MSTQDPSTISPKWGPSTKLVVGLTFVAAVAALLIRFNILIAPLILTFMLIYLLYPIASRLCEVTKLSWRFSVNIIFLILVVLLITSFTLAGLAVVQQLQSLVEIVIRFVNDLPELVSNLSSQVFSIGPFTLDMSQILAQYNLESLVQEIMSYMQPLLGRAGVVVGTLASGTATTIAWGLFVILVSYFILADAGHVPDRWDSLDLPGYDADIRRLGKELGHIWNAFLRGQVIIFVLIIILYTLMLSIFGLRYALGIAILAGLSRFVPYIGPLTVVIITALVAFFQNFNYFYLEPWQYMLLVVGVSLIVDQIFDNLVAPRFFGRALGVNPAGVVVVAIIAANLIGLIGLVLAAPLLASTKLLGTYTFRKMLDLDPWEEPDGERQQLEYPWAKWAAKAREWVLGLRKRKKD